MRVSMHVGKEGSAIHNDRKFDLDKAEHIDKELTNQNVYWCWNDDDRFAVADSFADAELEWYKRYQQSLDAKNARYLAQRHPERCKTIEDLYHGNLTKPTETIWQIGNRNDGVSPDLLLQCYKDYCAERADILGDKFQVLDFAMHVDEQGGPHIHERAVWECRDRDGNLMLGQNQALKELGVPLPEPDKPEGRYNNRKMTLDSSMRSLWQIVCARHGLQIDTVPVPGRRHLQTEEYIYEQQRQRIQELEHQVESAQNTLANVSKIAEKASEDAQRYQRSSEESKGVLEQIQALVHQTQEKLNILDRSSPEDPGRPSFWHKDIIKLSREDYDRLRNKAAVADTLDVRSIELSKQELDVQRRTAEGYKDGQRRGWDSLRDERAELVKEREYLRSAEKQFPLDRKNAFIGRHAQEQGLIQPADLAILETQWLQSKEHQWLKQMQEKAERQRHSQTIR